jgi:3-phosphoshikimate 1-carboxyvinyltransferase
MLSMKIRPARSISGTIKLPGDKSISHRAATIAAIAIGETRIDNFATSADCSSTLACLRALGVEFRWDGDAVIVGGVGKNGLRQPNEALDCGNSGTTMRLLAGILAGQPFDSVLTGDGSLNKRPMNRIIEPLTLMGAAITSGEGKAPLTIRGGQSLTGIEYHTPVASAQVKSCVLLAGLFANGKTVTIEATPTRDHTERLLAWFGAHVGGEGSQERTIMPGASLLEARDLTIPADISAAAYFMVAAACLPGSEVVMPFVGVNPTRNAIINVLRQFGANIETLESVGNLNEPIATIRVAGGLGNAVALPVLAGPAIATLIDEIPILAILGTQLKKGLEIRDAGELRVKESDRITAIVENLRRMGAAVTEFPDGFKVERSDLKGATVDSYTDHRIAMAFAIAGLLADGETEVKGAECADISFPGFFETLASVVK